MVSINLHYWDLFQVGDIVKVESFQCPLYDFEGGECINQFVECVAFNVVSLSVIMKYRTQIG